MADKKRNTSRPTSQTRANLKIKEKDAPVKSISAMARDEVKKAQEQDKDESISSVKSISAMARDERKSGKNVKEQTKLETKPTAKTSTVTPRIEPKRDRTVQDNKARRTSREPAWLARFRNTRIGRFVFEAYYELRHKVTWPTFEEARNMTLIVIVLSAVIGAALALVDFGLYHLFLLISGGK